MIRAIMVAGSMLVAAPAALAQVTPAGTGAMTASDTGMLPISGLDAARYVGAVADANKYLIDASKVALRKSKRDDVKTYAKRITEEYGTMQQSLLAALKNDQRTFARPADKLSTENQSALDLLAKAPSESFDNMYLAQQAQALQSAWAINKGYAGDGTDIALKQVAGMAVPKIEQHLSITKAMLPAGMGTH